MSDNTRKNSKCRLYGDIYEILNYIVNECHKNELQEYE